MPEAIAIEVNCTPNAEKSPSVRLSSCLYPSFSRYAASESVGVPVGADSKSGPGAGGWVDTVGSSGFVAMLTSLVGVEKASAVRRGWGRG